MLTTAVLHDRHSQQPTAAFDYDYNALDGGERSAISKGYKDIL